MKYLFLILLLVGCSRGPTSVAEIAEHDGCHVFEVSCSFCDSVFYTRCESGRVTTDWSKLRGKVRKHHSVDTVEEK